jgi:hypothetical protein
MDRVPLYGEVAGRQPRLAQRLLPSRRVHPVERRREFLGGLHIVLDASAWRSSRNPYSDQRRGVRGDRQDASARQRELRVGGVK